MYKNEIQEEEMGSWVMVKMDTFQDSKWRVSLDSEALFWISTFSHNNMRLSLK